MEVKETTIPGVLVIEPKVFGDARGYFLETFSAERYRKVGIPDFVQDNISFSSRGVLRGLHFQNPTAQGKLVYVLDGEVFDVCVDIRQGSPTFGKTFSLLLSSENKRQMFVPAGLAHGFCVTSKTALFAYKCTDYYAPKFENSLLWNDPDLGIDWPLQDVTVAEKDRKGLRLKDFPLDRLPLFSGSNAH